MSATAESPGLAGRLWIYQAERFPLGRTALLCAIFSAASVSVSAHLAGRAPPPGGAYFAAFLVTLAFFFQLRVLDEIKDAEDDARYRPERPIPRGLVRLSTIVRLGIASVALAGVAAWLIAPGLLLALALAWGWMALMTAEFFAPAWLKARPFVYLVSHMLVMPLIDLVVTGFEWMPHGTVPSALWLFLLLSFANGCVLEIGRKLWAPDAERAGVESYSGLLGPRRGAALWFACIGAALALLLSVGVATGVPVVTGAMGILAAAVTLRAGLRYCRLPTAKTAAAVETAAGTWVFVCYAAAGLAPYLRGIGPWS